MLASVMGSGHELQVDGIGGGHPLTSKIAIVSRSSRADADVDYLFAQASRAGSCQSTRRPTAATCWRASARLRSRPGSSQASAPETTVRIHNVNTGKLIEAIVQTPGGR